MYYSEAAAVNNYNIGARWYVNSAAAILGWCQP